AGISVDCIPARQALGNVSRRLGIVSQQGPERSCGIAHRIRTSTLDRLDDATPLASAASRPVSQGSRLQTNCRLLKWAARIVAPGEPPVPAAKSGPDSHRPVSTSVARARQTAPGRFIIGLDT